MRICNTHLSEPKLAGLVSITRRCIANQQQKIREKQTEKVQISKNDILQEMRESLLGRIVKAEISEPPKKVALKLATCCQYLKSVRGQGYHNKRVTSVNLTIHNKLN